MLVRVWTGDWSRREWQVIRAFLMACPTRDVFGDAGFIAFRSGVGVELARRVLGRLVDLGIAKKVPRSRFHRTTMYTINTRTRR